MPTTEDQRRCPTCGLSTFSPMFEGDWCRCDKPTISEQFETACAEASRKYAAGEDTTTIDAEVDRLYEELQS